MPFVIAYPHYVRWIYRIEPLSVCVASGSRQNIRNMVLIFFWVAQRLPFQIFIFAKLFPQLILLIFWWKKQKSFYEFLFTYNRFGCVKGKRVTYYQSNLHNNVCLKKYSCMASALDVNFPFYMGLTPPVRVGKIDWHWPLDPAEQNIICSRFRTDFLTF